MNKFNWILLNLWLIAMIEKDLHTNGAITSFPSNISTFLGGNASFHCGITGDQGVGGVMQFYKVTPGPSELLATNELVKNDTKYDITDKYRLNIFDVNLADEGRYECVLFPDRFEAYLTVLVKPIQVSLLWKQGGVKVFNPVKNEANNLTCIAEDSYPPATIRWFMGQNELTNQATSYFTDEDKDGDFDSYSTLEVILGEKDYFAPIKCVVDLPGFNEVAFSEVRVLYSSASRQQMRWSLVAVISIVFNQINVGY